MKKLVSMTHIVILASFIFQGCASRLPLRDSAGRPIKPSEVEAKKTNTNLILFTLGGGALSFGASFFIGSLIDRGVEGDSHSALWLTTGVGTALGILYFAQQGRVRDYNIAVVKVDADHKIDMKESITITRKRREEIEREKERLRRAREAQEAERRRLLEELAKKKKQQQKN